MAELEQLLGLFIAAVILAAAARRVGAPYPVGRELRAARGRAFEAVHASFADDQSLIAVAVRKQFKVQLAVAGPDAAKGDRARAQQSQLHRQALLAARQAIIAMRESNEIGDDAFHRIEEQLDWLEMAGGPRAD